MNLQQALEAAKTSSYVEESIVHVGRETSGEYCMMIVTHDTEDSWFVVHHQSTQLPPNGFCEDGCCSGDNYEEVMAELSDYFNIDSLNFAHYPVAPGGLLGLEIPYILHELFPVLMPEPESIRDWQAYEAMVTEHLSKLN